MKNMKVILSALVTVAALSACGGDSQNVQNPDAGFPQPAGTIPVNFTVDDSAAKIYAAGDLQWKGSFYWDKTTRVLTKDSTWTGGDGTTTEFPGLYDDGPWTAGGHEPANATANDHKYGVTVFVAPPATGSDTYEYGLQDVHACSQAAITAGTVVGSTCSAAWAWQGPNGTFAVNAGATTAITAQGLTTAATGDRDMQLTLDPASLDTTTTWDTSKVTIKGSAWNWAEAVVTKDSSGKFVFTLSDWVGTGKAFPHTGLLASGATPAWVWVLNGAEYKGADTNAISTGTTAATKAPGGSFAAQTITVNGDHNTSITVP